MPNATTNRVPTKRNLRLPTLPLHVWRPQPSCQGAKPLLYPCSALNSTPLDASDMPRESTRSTPFGMPSAKQYATSQALQIQTPISSKDLFHAFNHHGDDLHSCSLTRHRTLCLYIHPLNPQLKCNPRRSIHPRAPIQTANPPRLYGDKLHQSQSTIPQRIQYHSHIPLRDQNPALAS